MLLFVTAEYEGLLRLMLAALASDASFRDEKELVMAEAAFRALSSVFRDSTVLRRVCTCFSFSVLKQQKQRNGSASSTLSFLKACSLTLAQYRWRYFWQLPEQNSISSLLLSFCRQMQQESWFAAGTVLC